MPFISRDQIDPKIRAKFDEKYKAQLKEALHNPNLTTVERESLRAQIRQVGKPKVYNAKSGDTL